MGKRLFVGAVVTAFILTARSVDAQAALWEGAPAYSFLLRAAYRTLVPEPYREKLQQLGAGFFLNPQADGGGDSGGDGGSGTGGDGTGDSPGSPGTSDSTGPSDNTGPGENGDPDPGPTGPAQDAVSVDPTTAPTDPTAVNNAPIDFATQQAYDAVVNPFGGDFSTNPNSGESTDLSETGPGAVSTNPIPGEPTGPGPENPVSPIEPGTPSGPVSLPPAGPGGGPGVDVEINAVIVSGANSPWGAVKRAPGVRNVTVTGGIIALGKTPLPGEPPPGSPQPAWLRVVPDLRLLDGSVIPPVVPNIIDIRWLNCPIQVIEKPSETPGG